MAIVKKEMSQFAVIGMGRFGFALTKALYNQGKEVLAIDINPDRVNLVADCSTHAAIADASDENVLRSLGIKNFDAVIICMGGNMQASILTTLICKEIGVPFIVCKATSEKHKTVLQKVGGDYIVVPEEDIAIKVALQLTSPRLNDMMELSKNFSIAEMEIPTSWEGNTLMQLNIRKKYGVIILLIKRGGDVIVTPDANFQLATGDNMILGGSQDKIEKLIDKLASLK